MPSVSLADRALIRVSGPDAEHFLQNIVTADLSDLPEGAIKPCALLTPQGKILFDFLIARDGADTFLIDCRADVADELSRRLMLYRLRAKAEISKLDQTFVTIEWGGDSGASGNDSTQAFRDLRFVEPIVWRRHGGAAGSDVPEDWHLLRIENGVAESGSDYQLSDVFPHDVLLDQNGGVGFRKGCYVGQEVVSRMQHRGTARRRVLVAHGDGPLPAPGTEITANGRAIGTLGTVAGERGLAIVRIDRVKDAVDAGVPILADETAVALAIPPHARFTFPQDADAGAD
ncbi:folate-binding protein YgfZ [Mesorhizobium sp. J428]|uniref:CAF17-like 4Fe-4S cluster assembly/insertion protein YgfZ n=1 Tax=Mesorhizobium sp. J428 TaxID=2898440 RepID=UPI002150C963|nr:folate-binding protein YgfZ [Mesorhizobium sp. J428]MCR5859066.1 folate-binding protein YgfZ [Mesorhizobium sp. J428]